MSYYAMFESLKEALNTIGIHQGDKLYVASGIKNFLHRLADEYGMKTFEDRNKALHDLVNTLQKVVGEEGTLIFPVFSWEWCRGNGFNIKTTKGEVGALSNWVLENRPDFKRTHHPIYSFMVWGKDTDYLTGLDNQDAWSHHSPFYYFHTHGAKQLLFNVEAYQGYTFGHYLEQEVGVPYRHPKYFFGEYTDEHGITEKRMYSMYVRDLDYDCVCGIHNDWLIENDVATQIEWETNMLTMVDFEKSYRLICDDMLKDNGKNTLIFTTGKLDWSMEQTVPFEVKGIE